MDFLDTKDGGIIIHQRELCGNFCQPPLKILHFF